VSRPIDLVLSRLEQFKLRANGADRWRSCCPSHGGSNPSALSVGLGNDDAVLLKCWQGCSTSEVASALGLELHELFPPRPQPGGGSEPIRRRRLLTAGQALDLLSFEIGLTLLCASDMAKGDALDEATRERLLLGAARVSMMRDEVNA
jgi:hypothetical protein